MPGLLQTGHANSVTAGSEIQAPLEASQAPEVLGASVVAAAAEALP